MTDKELMQLALDALEWNLPVIQDYGDKEQLNTQYNAITALRDRLAQPEQEHTGFMDSKINPIQRPWVGLTGEEVKEIIDRYTIDDHGFDIWCDGLGVVKAIEAKLKEKNK